MRVYHSFYFSQIGALEIERVFLSHPLIRSCAVVGTLSAKEILCCMMVELRRAGVPDESYGERVGLIVEPKPNVYKVKR